MTGVSRPAILSTLQGTLLALVLFGLNTWGIYTAFTSRGQIAMWDFHPRWLGLRAMLRDGADPYSDEVTLDIQLQMLGRPARPDEDQQAFAYPLHVMALLLLIVVPVPWLPTWPLAWFAAAGRYASYTDFESTLTMLTRSTWLANIVAALPVVWTLDRWWRAPERWGATSDWALGMLIAISALAAPRTTHVNQLILLLSLFLVFRQLSRPGIVAVVEIGLLVGLWVMDLLLSPSINSPEHMVWQHRFVSPILPVGLMLALLCISPRAVREMD